METNIDNEGLTFLDDGEVLYDDLFLLSETDAKGIVTYTSESFARIANYSPTELVGQPHNIVRHPDMPRAAFKSLWDSVQSKGFWTGIVKKCTKEWWILLGSCYSTS
jgi:PAS domain-containing protein